MAEAAPSLVQMTPMSVEESKDFGSATGADSFQGYFDTVPDSSVFLPPSHPTRGPKPSTAEFKEKIKGVYSQDRILDHNPDELWRFLVNNLRSPHIMIHLLGTRTETRTRNIRDTEGNISTETFTKTFTDFSIRLDVSKYVLPQWSQIVAHPSKKPSKKAGEVDQAMPTVRETLEEYASSRNPFKEFRMAKVVLWDTDRLKKLLTDLVRSTGYRRDVEVKFPKQDYKVVVLASNMCSRAAHSTVVRVLCVVSCLCICFWPAWAIVRKRMKNRLDCEYGMGISADEFYSRNCAEIHATVLRRIESAEEADDQIIQDDVFMYNQEIGQPHFQCRKQ